MGCEGVRPSGEGRLEALYVGQGQEGREWGLYGGSHLSHEVGKLKCVCVCACVLYCMGSMGNDTGRRSIRSGLMKGGVVGEEGAGQEEWGSLPSGWVPAWVTLYPGGRLEGREEEGVNE